jgi:hypothetical protein
MSSTRAPESSLQLGDIFCFLMLKMRNSLLIVAVIETGKQPVASCETSPFNTLQATNCDASTLCELAMLT